VAEPDICGLDQAVLIADPVELNPLGVYLKGGLIRTLKSP